MRKSTNFKREALDIVSGARDLTYYSPVMEVRFVVDKGLFDEKKRFGDTAIEACIPNPLENQYYGVLEVLVGKETGISQAFYYPGSCEPDDYVLPVTLSDEEANLIKELALDDFMKVTQAYERELLDKTCAVYKTLTRCMELDRIKSVSEYVAESVRKDANDFTPDSVPRPSRNFRVRRTTE